MLNLECDDRQRLGSSTVGTAIRKLCAHRAEAQRAHTRSRACDSGLLLVQGVPGPGLDERELIRSRQHAIEFGGFFR